MEARQVAASIPGFVQGVVNLLNHGYVYFSQGAIAEGKDPEGIDKKLARKYETEIPRWERARRRAAGRESVRYLRHEDQFVLLAQPGQGRFFEEEDWQDARRKAMHFRGYVISYRRSTVTKRYHASVAIERQEYLGIKAHMVQMSTHRSVEGMRRQFQRLPFEPYARVRRQYLNVLRAVNKKRKAAGYELVPSTALRLRRKRPKVYAAVEEPRLAEAQDVA